MSLIKEGMEKSNKNHILENEYVEVVPYFLFSFSFILLDSGVFKMNFSIPSQDATSSLNVTL